MSLSKAQKKYLDQQSKDFRVRAKKYKKQWVVESGPKFFPRKNKIRIPNEATYKFIDDSIPQCEPEEIIGELGIVV